MMRLQEELKQSKPFSGPATEAMLSIVRTAAVIEHVGGEALKPHGLTPTQYNVLRILRGADEAGLCGREIGERLVSRVPDVPRLLERLEDSGVIRRTRDKDDRRHVTARITAKGLRLLDKLDPVLEEVERLCIGTLSREALESLIDSLGIIRNNTLKPQL